MFIREYFLSGARRTSVLGNTFSTYIMDLLKDPYNPIWTNLLSSQHIIQVSFSVLSFSRLKSTFESDAFLVESILGACEYAYWSDPDWKLAIVKISSITNTLDSSITNTLDSKYRIAWCPLLTIRYYFSLSLVPLLRRTMNRLNINIDSVTTIS